MSTMAMQSTIKCTCCGYRLHEAVPLNGSVRGIPCPACHARDLRVLAIERGDGATTLTRGHADHFNGLLRLSRACSTLPVLWRLAEPLARAHYAMAPDGGHIVDMLDGFKLAIRPREDAWQGKMYFDREYEPGTMALFEHFVRSGMRAVDVGANIGIMTLKLSQLVGETGRVIAFEPEPETYTRLLGNIVLNHVDNVDAMRYGVGAAPAKLPIYRNPNTNIGNTSLVWTSDHNVLAGEIQIRTLDETLAGRKVDFIKIDVEGFEAEVIRGAMRVLREHRPVILMEFIKAMPSACGDVYAAYDLIMATGLYACHKPRHGKFKRSADLAPVLGRADLPDEDNIVFVPVG